MYLSSANRCQTKTSNRRSTSTLWKNSNSCLIVFKIDGKIYTAACTGTVLPGVTRRSIIELLKDWGYEVIEGKLAIAAVMKAAEEGKLEEVFGTGTAAFVSPVKELDWEGKVANSSGGKIRCV